MRKSLMKTVVVFLLAMVSSMAQAQQLTLNGGKHSYAKGETVGILYEGAVKGDKILLYHNLAMLPLKEKGVAAGDNGMYEVPGILQPGDYRAVLVGKDGGQKTQVAFVVQEEPLPDNGHRIFLVSDIHVMSPDLVLDPTNSAFLKDMGDSRKLQKESYEIFCAYVDTIKALRPELVIIPGDLSKDGELLSHQTVAAKLHELLDMGIPTLVIPGNHDMECDVAYSYTSAGRKKAENITPEQFAEIYYDFGLKDAIERDPISLSYVCEPIEGLRFIGIDDCRIPSRGDTRYGDGEYGRIRQATLDWVIAQADKAVEEKKVVVAAVHHQMLQHFVGQETFMSSAATENGDSIARLFADHGIRVVLTGHMHMPNVSKVPGFEEGDSITEVSSASTISYPSQYRVLTVSNDLSTMRIDTRMLNATESLSQLQQAAWDKIDQTLDLSMGSIASRYMSSFNSMINEFAAIPDFAGIVDDVPSDPNELTAIAVEAFGNSLRQIVFTISEGNEHLKDAVKLVTEQLEKDCDKLCELVFDNQNESTRSFLSYAMFGYLMEMAESSLKSMLSDTSYLGTNMANQTDDLYLTIALKDVDEGIAETTMETVGTPAQVYSVSGQVVGVGVDARSLPKGVYVVKKGNKTSKIAVK